MYSYCARAWSAGLTGNVVQGLTCSYLTLTCNLVCRAKTSVDICWRPLETSSFFIICSQLRPHVPLFTTPGLSVAWQATRLQGCGCLQAMGHCPWPSGYSAGLQGESKGEHRLIFAFTSGDM